MVACRTSSQILLVYCSREPTHRLERNSGSSQNATVERGSCLESDPRRAEDNSFNVSTSMDRDRSRDNPDDVLRQCATGQRDSRGRTDIERTGYLEYPSCGRQRKI